MKRFFREWWPAFAVGAVPFVVGLALLAAEGCHSPPPPPKSPPSKSWPKEHDGFPLILKGKT